ncbi:MAG: TetR/AcrR family transcriptional regulator [Exilibacterium sp.]
MSKMVTTKYYNRTFEKIPQQKRLKVLKIAARELASAGLSGARMKDIANQAEISYGSLYNYFPTRDDMIRTIIQEGRSLQEAIFAEARGLSGDFFAILEKILIQTQNLSREHPALIAIWVEVSHSYNERFAADVMDLENDGIKFWKHMLLTGVESGDLSPQTNLAAAAFLIDNAISGLLKSCISSVQHQRLKLFFEPPLCAEIDKPGTNIQGKEQADDQFIRDSLMAMFRTLLQNRD